MESQCPPPCEPCKQMPVTRRTPGHRAHESLGVYDEHYLRRIAALDKMRGVLEYEQRLLEEPRYMNCISTTPPLFMWKNPSAQPLETKYAVVRTIRDVHNEARTPCSPRPRIARAAFTPYVAAAAGAASALWPRRP